MHERSRENPKILWIDDPEIVGDLVAIVAPFPGNLDAQKIQDRLTERREGGMAPIMCDVPVHQPPQSFDRIEMRAVRRNEGKRRGALTLFRVSDYGSLSS